MLGNQGQSLTSFRDGNLNCSFHFVHQILVCGGKRVLVATCCPKHESVRASERKICERYGYDLCQYTSCRPILGANR